MRINQWLDSCPRPRVRVGGTMLPIFFVTGLSGVGVAFLAVMVSAIWTGASLVVSIGVSALACLTFVLFGVIRSLITRQQKIVLLEHFLVVQGVAFLALELLSLPVLVYLDLLTVGLSVFLAFGRIGCFLCGCCYGIESPVGVVYPPECGHRSPRRRFPIQLIESIAWTILALLSFGAVLLKAPGTALTLVLACYGALRAILEPLRGDPRPKYLGLTAASWMALASLAAAIYLQQRTAPLDLRLLAGIAVFSIFVPIVLAKTHRYWLLLEFDRRLKAEVSAVGAEFGNVELGPSPVVRSARDLIFAASYASDASGKSALSVSVSSPSRRLGRAEAGLLIEWIVDGLGLDGAGVDPIPIEGGAFLASLEHEPARRV